MEAGTNELAQRLFALVLQKRCANFGGIAKVDCLLPRQRCREIEAWFYITKRNQDLSTQIIYGCKALILRRDR